MDETEKIAFRYLESLGYDPVYEPDGNITPDFVISSNIAIEVRRLNQQERTSGKFKGLEETSVPLYQMIEKKLSQFPKKPLEKSYWVSYNFERPLPSVSNLGKIIEKKLNNFISSSSKNKITKLQLTENFQMEIREATDIHPWTFHLACIDDQDSGGWILSEVQKNINLCVSEKEKKVRPYKEKYKEWWLVLVNQISSGRLYDEEKKSLQDTIKIGELWNKVVIVNARDYRDFFEVT